MPRWPCGSVRAHPWRWPGWAPAPGGVPAPHLRCTAMQRHRAQMGAAHLLADGVFIGSRAHIGGAVEYRLQRHGAAGKVGHHDLQPFAFEIPQQVGQRQRQVVEHALPAHGHGDAPQAWSSRLLRQHGRRKHRSRREGGYGAKCASAEHGTGHGKGKAERPIVALQQSCLSMASQASGTTPGDYYVGDSESRPAKGSNDSRQSPGHGRKKRRACYQRYPRNRIPILTRKAPVHSALRTVGMSATYIMM